LEAQHPVLAMNAVEVIVTLIVQREGRSLETSVIIL
jgi:hypothetical protein